MRKNNCYDQISWLWWIAKRIARRLSRSSSISANNQPTKYGILTTRLYPSSCESACLWSDTRFANLRSLNNTEFDDDNKEMAVVFQMQLSTSMYDLNNASEELKFDTQMCAEITEILETVRW